MVSVRWLGAALLTLTLCSFPPPAKANELMDPVTRASTDFAVDLYRALAKSRGNLFISPYGLSTALTAAYIGARAETALEMAKVLHLNGQAPLAGFEALRLHLASVSKEESSILLNANALWSQKGHAFSEDYLTLVQKSIDASVRQLDFENNSAQAVQEINTWVEEKTKGRIKNLLELPSPPVLRLLITNAVYFKAKWQLPFDPNYTNAAEFKVSPERIVQAPTMQSQASYRYFEDGDLKALELMYAGGSLSTVVLLPKKDDGLSALETALTPDRIQSVVHGLQPQTVHVFLPKFRIESKIRIKDALSSLGMKEAFDLKTADFSGIDGQKFLAISDVLHQTFVDVDEYGTEAAAASAIQIVGSAGPVETKEFRADHPFLFVIREIRSGTILFVGRLVEPPTVPG